MNFQGRTVKRAARGQRKQSGRAAKVVRTTRGQRKQSQVHEADPESSSEEAPQEDAVANEPEKEAASHPPVLDASMVRRTAERAAKVVRTTRGQRKQSQVHEADSLSSLSSLSSSEEEEEWEPQENAKKPKNEPKKEAVSPPPVDPLERRTAGIRRSALSKNTFYSWLTRFADHPDFDLVLQHAVRVIDLLLEAMQHRRRGRPCNVKVLWLGERLNRALNQPEDLPGLTRPRARWLLALRQLVLQRRTGEAARLLERLLLRGYVPASSMLWRIGFHVLSRESEGRAEEARARRMVPLRASRLDAFMKQLCRLERSLIDRENLILEYVLHCLADQDVERAVHVMGFLAKDSLPSEAGLKKEVEAKRVYHLRQCYLGLAHAVIWSRRMEEGRKENATDGDLVFFEAEQAAQRCWSYLELSLPVLADLGEVIDVFLEAWIKVGGAFGHEEKAEELLRSYADRGTSPNGPRWLATWRHQYRGDEQSLELMLTAARAAPNDWDMVGKFLDHFPDHEACAELLFRFLDHPAEALNRTEPWIALLRLLERGGGIQALWEPRSRLWERCYFLPELLRTRPHLAEAAYVLRGAR